MTRRILDHDAMTGITTYHSYDHATKQTVIESEQDVEPIIEQNIALYNDDDYKKKGIKNSWWHVANIPNNIINKWLLEDGIDVFNKNHFDRVKKKLQDPDYRYLRTGAGKI